MLKEFQFNNSDVILEVLNRISVSYYNIALTRVIVEIWERSDKMNSDREKHKNPGN